jgi:CRP-like cAMP-binding protein
MDAPPGFEVRAVEVEAGGHRIYHEGEWSDALVVVGRGEIELESLGGATLSFRRGALLWLEGLPLRALHNRGREPALLLAVSRDEFSAARPSQEHGC